jgi:hypothetical protein
MDFGQILMNFKSLKKIFPAILSTRIKITIIINGYFGKLN